MQLDKLKIFGVLVLLLGLSTSSLSAQEVDKKAEKKSNSYVRQAEKAKQEKDFAGAEANYRRALSADKKNAEAQYNFGHLYDDQKMDADAMNQLLKTVKNAQTKELKHKAFHNLGNAYMDHEDYAQAVQAYKDALRNDPTDDETRYNLAIAKKKLEENPDQGGGDDDSDEDSQSQDDQNSKENKESKDQDQDQDQDENQDQGDQQQKDQDQQEKDQQNQEGQDHDEDQGGEGDQDQQEQEDQQEGDQDQDQDADENEQEQNQEQQPDEGGMSDDQAESLLRAADNLEKGVQKKMNEKKGDKKPPQRNQKDW